MGKVEVVSLSWIKRDDANARMRSVINVSRSKFEEDGGRRLLLWMQIANTTTDFDWYSSDVSAAIIKSLEAI